MMFHLAKTTSTAATIALFLFGCMSGVTSNQMNSTQSCPNLCQLNQEQPRSTTVGVTTTQRSKIKHKSNSTQKPKLKPIVTKFKAHPIAPGALDPEAQFFDLALSLVKPEMRDSVRAAYYSKNPNKEVIWKEVWGGTDDVSNFPLYFKVIFEVSNLLGYYFSSRRNVSDSMDMYTLWRLANRTYKTWKDSVVLLGDKQLDESETIFNEKYRRQGVVYIWQKMTEDLAELFNVYCNKMCGREHVIRPQLMATDYGRY